MMPQQMSLPSTTMIPGQMSVSSTTRPQSLYEFKTHTFTTAGKTGREGPTISEVRNAYSGVSWAQNSEFLNMTKQGIQEWKVPATGSYTIRAVGAAGGNPGTYNRGRDVYLITTLTKGEVINILVGQKGITPPNTKNGSGGGGTFVIRGTETAIIVAGGGGGRSREGNYNNLSSNANSTSKGNNSGDDTGNGGGDNGNGGSNGDFTGGGGGFITNGGSANWATGGLSFKNGGNGGIVTNPSYIQHGSVGGFGGGGSTIDDGGGGGGGYSGGSGGKYFGAGPTKNGGGGGGSYGITSLIDNGATNTGDGFVVITANF
jgi:hypothetical protein